MAHIEAAPAKINLALHIVGQRPDNGYHLLESPVVFAGDNAADRLTAAPAATDHFTVDGPNGAALAGGDNLVTRARDWLRARCGGGPIDLRLEKNLPVASGIGGGSADAAATLRVLATLWQAHDAIAPEAYDAICTALGADVAMCLESRAVVARGIGERLTPVRNLPALPCVLVNPGIAVETRSVFAALSSRANTPLPALPDRWNGVHEVSVWLATNSRNDLEPPARSIAPVIGSCLAALDAEGALFGRMSGSGATCFGLFETSAEADRAAMQIAAEQRDWWVQPTMLNADAPTASKTTERDYVQA